MIPAAPPVTSVVTPRRALFGGYALVAFTCAWLAGDWLSGLPPLQQVLPLLWLALAAGGLVGAIGSGLAGRRYGLSLATRRWLRISLAAFALLLWLGLGAARASAANPTRDPLSIAKYATGVSVQARGQVVAEPDERNGYRALTVEVTSIQVAGDPAPHPATGRLEANVYGPSDWFAPDYGDTVILTGALKPLDGSYAPGDVVARMPVARARILARGGGSPLLAALFQLRVAIGQAIERTLPEPEASLLIGILLGLKSPALRVRLPLFIATGLIHLVVPAGLKVSIFAEFATRAARRLGRWPQTLLALLAVGAYAAIGGGGPAAVRAAIMGALLALAPALGRAYNVYTALALATLAMTVVDPILLYDAGFQLTVLATFALPLLTPAIQHALLRLAGPFRARRITTVSAEQIAVTIAAQIATVPVLALTFHEVSLIAPVANLLTVPLLAPLLVIGGALALAATFGWSLVALTVAWVVWPLLAWVNGVITICAALPLAAMQIGQASALLAPIYYALLVALVIALAPRLAAARAASSGTTHAPLGRAALLSLLGLALLGSLGATAPALAAQGVAHLDFLDVGPGGSAILLRLPDGSAALLDGGPSGPALETMLAARLPFWQRSLTLVALTDTRAGDARGLEDVATHYTIASAVDAGMLHPTTEYIAYQDAMRRAGATRSQVRAGNVIHLSASAALTALAPPQTLYPPHEGDTNASDDLILRLDAPGLRALFLGAADTYALDALAGSGQPLAADIVEVALPRGARLNLDGPLRDVLALAHPRLIVICDSPAPTPTGLAAIIASAGPTDAEVAQALDTQVMRVSDQGAVSLSGSASGWALG